MGGVVCCGPDRGSLAASPGPSTPAPTTKSSSKTQLANKVLSDYYRVERQLGVGASCEVVRAVAADDNQQYAIKLMDKVPTNEHLYESERRLLSKLKHGNVIEFVESFEDLSPEGKYVIVTRLCRGGELFDRVANGKFSEATAAKLTRDMLEAVAYCHSINISHRDLKPENFVFDDQHDTANMRLIDFGCAIDAPENEEIHDIAGSPYYIAPEVISQNFTRTGKTWKASDMWSLGVILFVLLQGYPPFNGSTNQAIFRKIKKGNYSIKHPVSPQARDLISKLLVLDPSARVSAQEALKHPWISDHGVAPTAPLLQDVVTGLKSFQESCKLKKAVRHMMAHQLTEQDTAMIQLAFKKYDKNGDGKLQPQEIALMLKEIGSDQKVEDFIAEFDEDGDNEVDVEEFKQVYVDGQLRRDSVDDLQARFDAMDENKDGMINAQELAKVLQIDESAAKRLIAGIDDNGNGEIDFEEWLTAFHKTA